MMMKNGWDEPNRLSCKQNIVRALESQENHIRKLTFSKIFQIFLKIYELTTELKEVTENLYDVRHVHS